MSSGSSIGVGRPAPGLGTGTGGGKAKRSNTFTAFLTNMEEFSKKVPNLSLGGSFPGNNSTTTKNATPAKNLAVQPPPARPGAKVTNVAAHVQKPSISRAAQLKSLTAAAPSYRHSPASQATPFTLGGKSSSTSDWSASGFINDDKGLSYSSTAAARSRPIFSAPSKSKTIGTTTHEIVHLSSESEDEDEEEDEDENDEEEDDEEEEDGEDEDEDEDEEEDDEEDEGDDNDDEEDDDEDEGDDDIEKEDFSQQPPQKSNSLVHRQDVRSAVRMPMKSSSSVAASVLPQLRDHNQKSVKEPRSFDRWKSSIQQLPESSLATPPSSQDRQKSDVKRITLKDDICLYESIKATSSSSAPKPSTVFKSRLPEPFQIRSATKISFENRQKRPSHKRKVWADTVVPAAKRQRREDIRRDSTVFELGSTRRRVDEESERAVDRSNHHHEQDGRYGDCPFPLPAPPRRPASPPPIEEHRVVMQFTVFRTWSPLTEAFDGNLTGKIVRSGSFLDKIAANKRAESLLPSPSPAVARMELDYGEEGSSRNGMFFGRVEYKNGTFVYVYVDCEYQQFGKIDPSEYDGKHMNALYKRLCLSPRYDVFVFLRKPMEKQEAIVYEYVEEARPEPAVEEIDDDGSDHDNDHEDIAEHGVIEIGTSEACEPDNSVDENGGENPVGKDIGDSASDIVTFEGLGEVNEIQQSHNNETEGAVAVAETGRDDAILELEHVADCNQDNVVEGKDDDEHAKEDALVARLVVGGDKNTTQPANDHQDTLGSHFQPKFEGSYTTLALANRKALDAFAKWTRPQPPALMDALMYYRDVLQPTINQLRRQFHEDQDTREVTREAEISWEPCPQFRYEYEAINVVVVKSEMQGPLDLTGAFS